MSYRKPFSSIVPHQRGIFALTLDENPCRPKGSLSGFRLSLHPGFISVKPYCKETFNTALALQAIRTSGRGQTSQSHNLHTFPNHLTVVKVLIQYVSSSRYVLLSRIITSLEYTVSSIVTTYAEATCHSQDFFSPLSTGCVSPESALSYFTP